MKSRSGLVLAAVVLGSVFALPSGPASAASAGWSTSIPNLGDGTYACGKTIDTADDSIQDCLRRVGRSWQPVTIYRNGTTVNLDVSFSLDSIENAVAVDSMTCTSVIPPKVQRACWGRTRNSTPSGTWIQNHNIGGIILYPDKTVIVGDSFSPTRQIP